MWLFWALIGHIGNALIVISDKASIEKRVFNPKALAFISGATNVFTFVLVPWFLLPASPAVIFASILSGFTFVASVFFYFLALDQDEASRVVPAIGSLVPVFTFVLSFLILGERLKGELFLGFLLLVLGGILVEFRSVFSFFSRSTFSVFSYEAAAALFSASSAVSLKYAFLGTDDFSAFLWSRFGFVAAALPFLFFRSVRQEFTFSGLKLRVTGDNWWFLGSRILGGIMPLVLTAAIALGSVTLVTSVQGAQYGFLFILALIFSYRWPQIFGEEFNKKIIVQKSIALVFIVLGLALFL